MNELFSHCLGSLTCIWFFIYLFSFIYIFIYRCFPMVLWFFLVYRLQHPLAYKIAVLPHCLGSLTWFFFHLFIFSFMDAVWPFSEFFRCTSFDVHRHAKFQLSTSPGKYRSVISVSELLSGKKELYILLAGCAYTLCKHTNHVSPLSRVAHLNLIFHLFLFLFFFIYLYFHIWMLYYDSVIFPGAMA